MKNVNKCLKKPKEKSNIWDVYYHIYSTEIRLNWDDDLPLENTWDIKNMIIFITAFFDNIEYNHYYSCERLVKCSYRSASY